MPVINLGLDPLVALQMVTECHVNEAAALRAGRNEESGSNCQVLQPTARTHLVNCDGTDSSCKL